MKTKYLIIGAGISGLTFASYCKENYLIIEKDSEVGGYCKTHYNKDYVSAKQVKACDAKL